MKSSLPQIFNKDLYQISIPQKQSPEYSLFLRTNNFTLKHTNQKSTRYNNNDSIQRANKSMDVLLSEKKVSSISKQLQNTNGMKSLLTQRRKLHSKSFFIEQKNSQTVSQVDSFKAIRKRVMQEMTIIQKSLAVINKSQKSIKQELNIFKTNQLKDLQQFEQNMRRQIQQLRNIFKALKKQTKVEMKVNKQQAVFLQQQANNFKQIMKGFQHQSDKLRREIINDVPVLKS